MKAREVISNIEAMAESTDLLEKYPLLLEQISDPDQINSARLLELLLGVACKRYENLSMAELFEEARRRGLFASRPHVLFNKNDANGKAWFRLRYGKYVTFDDGRFVVTNTSKDIEGARIIAESRSTFKEDIAAAASVAKTYPHSLQAVFISYFVDAVYAIDEAWEKTYLLRRPMLEFLRHSVDNAPVLEWFTKCSDPDIYIDEADDASWLREVNDDTRVFITGDTLIIEKTMGGGVVAKWCCSELPIPVESDTRIFMYHILMLLWMIGIKPRRRFIDECFMCTEVV